MAVKTQLTETVSQVGVVAQRALAGGPEQLQPPRLTAHSGARCFIKEGSYCYKAGTGRSLTSRGATVVPGAFLARENTKNCHGNTAYWTT
jgi:hypothetical protein